MLRSLKRTIVAAVLAACSLSACASARRAEWRFRPVGFSGAELEEVREGVRLWRKLGVDVDVSDSPSAHPIYRVTGGPIRAENGRAGCGSDGCSVELYPLWWWDDGTVRAVTAHEVGHVVTGRWDHLTEGSEGAMAEYLDGSTDFTEADRAWACEGAGYGCD